MLVNVMGNLGKKALINLVLCLAKVISSKLTTEATSSILDKFERKISGKGATYSLYSFQMKMWIVLLKS